MSETKSLKLNYTYELGRKENFTAPGDLLNYHATPNVNYFYDNLPRGGNVEDFGASLHDFDRAIDG